MLYKNPFHGFSHTWHILMGIPVPHSLGGRTMKIVLFGFHVNRVRSVIQRINEQIHYAGQYLANKPIFAQMLKTRNKKKFRQEHQAELELYESAVKFFKEKNADGKIPSMQSLKSEKEKLTILRSAQYETYKYFKEYQKELRTVCSNVDSILGQPHTLEADRTPNHDIS